MQEKFTNLTCPRCDKPELKPVVVHNSLSRRDNETYICSACGTEEAFIDAHLYGMLSPGFLVRENKFRAKLNIREL